MRNATDVEQPERIQKQKTNGDKNERIEQNASFILSVGQQHKVEADIAPLKS